MTQEELKNIIENQKMLSDTPNTKLVEYMDMLTTDFEETKEKIINLTFYLDKVEELYNSILKEYQNRIK
jgi:ribosomal protein S17E